MVIIIIINLLSTSGHKTSAEPTIITESFRQLEGHTNRITGLCWSLNKCGMLASVSYDWTAQVETHFIVSIMYYLFLNDM